MAGVVRERKCVGVPFVAAAALVLLALTLLLFFMSGFIRYIPNNRAGVIEKRVSGRGSVRSGFIALRGEAGFQPSVLRGGWHVFTPFQYRIHTIPLVTIPQGSIGYVFARDGAPLPSTQALAGNVTADLFQDVAAFLAAGERRGRQLQVLVEGTYYVNRLFATVEMIPKTVIEVGYAGVVVSYTGGVGADLSGADYKHGEMVVTGSRDVWSVPLLPGKYAFNTYAGKIIPVPATNIILKWMRDQAGAHGLDANLAEVSLITKDAFEPSLPLSVVIHIDYRKAPLVIQRFGDVRKLVEQTLDPMVAAYFNVHLTTSNPQKQNQSASNLLPAA